MSAPISRGAMGPLPYAAVGDGPPLVSLAGLSPTTGFEGDAMVRATLGPLAALARTRRVVLFNRRPGLPRGMTMAAGLAGRLLGRRLIRDNLGDLATTIEAEDDFDLARLPAIRAPTMILAGADDRFYTPELFAETARLIPGSTLRLLDGRGHVTVMRDRRFREALTAFLAA